MVVIIFDVAFKGTEEIHHNTNAALLTSLTFFTHEFIGNVFKMSTIFVPQCFWDHQFLKSKFVLHLKSSWGKVLLLIWNTQVLMEEDSSSVLIYLPQNATGTRSQQTQSAELFLTLTFICSMLRERARSKYFPHLVMNNSMEFKDHQ